ncbi:MAG: SDR family NAD(P)-dependent oxidoreductase [Gammaproteobacteria bacterium]|nr:SDR family NAD(P)-dependent oxidoreductase [Gammaproteobacteria bacterium]MDH5322334.1 SDR family NAD(P)-dependent oxidoreductase [Gammaproteobacteria bacterium]
MTTSRRNFLLLAAAAALPACAGTKKIATPGVPLSPFDEDSTADEVLGDLDLTGKLVVVTGCTSGIGFETMRALAARGAWVVGTSRTREAADAACKSVPGQTTPLQLELSDFRSVVDCANAIRSINAPLDILICNAGYLGAGGAPQLVDGIERHFAINHLGHFVFVNRLLGRLYMADQGRIVVVASRAAYTSAPRAGIEFDNLDAHRDYEDRRAYGHSKLANALFALQLGTLLRGTRITANALHPGVINTEIDRNMSRFMQTGFAVATALGYGKSIAQGAATSCYVATSPALGATSGKYFEDCNAVTIVGEGHLHDAEMAARLWQVSEDLTREFLVTHRGEDLNDFERAARKRRE